MNNAWLMKQIHLIPAPILYGAIVLGALWLVSKMLSWGATAKRVQAMDPAEEIQNTLACSYEQASILLKEYSGNTARAIMDVKTGRKSLPSPAAYIEEGYAVLLRGGEPKPDAILLGRLLAQASGQPQTEIGRLLIPGGSRLLARGLKQEVAQSFCELLLEGGKDAVCIEAKLLPNPTIGGDVGGLTLDEEAVRLEVRASGTVTIPYGDLQIICVGVLRADTKVASDGSVPAGRGELMAHLYVGGATPRRFTLEARKFNYAALGAQKKESGIANFQQLLYNLADKAPQIGRDRSWHIFMDDMRVIAYKSEEDLATEGTSRLAVALAESMTN